MILNKKIENYWLILLSLPSWECGLKYDFTCVPLLVVVVAPFVGVWIEICTLPSGTGSPCVAPFVGVWIEIILILASSSYCSVAPFVGVWIEIYSFTAHSLPCRVAPFVGVWIEILHWLRQIQCGYSRSLRGSVD